MWKSQSGFVPLPPPTNLGYLWANSAIKLADRQFLHMMLSTPSIEDSSLDHHGDVSDTSNTVWKFRKTQIVMVRSLMHKL